MRLRVCMLAALSVAACSGAEFSSKMEPGSMAQSGASSSGNSLGDAGASGGAPVDSGAGGKRPGDSTLTITGIWESADSSERDAISPTEWRLMLESGSETTTLNKKVIGFSNSERFLILREPSSAAFNPSTYERVEWYSPSDSELFYCTTSFGCAGAKGAELTGCSSSASADASDLLGNGCGGFAWTQLERAD